MSPHPVCPCPCVRGEIGHRDRYTQGRLCEDEVQIGVMLLPVKGRGLAHTVSNLLTLDFGCPASRVGTNNDLLASLLGRGTWSQLPQETGGSGCEGCGEGGNQSRASPAISPELPHAGKLQETGASVCSSTEGQPPGGTELLQFCPAPTLASSLQVPRAQPAAGQKWVMGTEGLRPPRERG